MRKLIAAAAVPFVGLLVAATAHATSFGGDGTYTVGGDIQPGIYHTTGPASEDMGCYWERDKNLSGTTSSIIANDYVKGPATVQISATDAAFKTQGCAKWVLTAPATPAPLPAPAPAPVPRPAPTGSAG